MRQKSLNENIKAREQSKGEMTSNIAEVDDLLDDEGWDILNSLTDDELYQLNSDFDPENLLIPTGERVNHERHIPGATTIEQQQEVKPMFSQKDLVKTMNSKLGQHQPGSGPAALQVNSTLPPKENKEGETMFDQKDLVSRLNEMVAQSKPVIQNEKIRQKEEERKRKKEEEINRKFKKSLTPDVPDPDKATLTMEEEELLADATEEELIEAAALLNMTDILTSDQINAVFAGDKPTGGMSSHVKGTLPKRARISKNDEETDLDVVALNRHLKEDTDDLFYLCVNNQPKLEKQTLELIIGAVENSKKIKHLSLAMIGLIDKQCIALAQAIGCNKQIETLNLDSNIIGLPGIEALMHAVSEHPTLREVKVSNQKQPFGGQGEECMANAIAHNQNILKFGYSFRQAASRNKCDRAIIRNNEFMRQKRKIGEEAYDLKAVCKIRDPWPQPWIRVKGQRLLSSQLETKVTDMGLMIDPDAETGRESRGPKIREEREAKPLDIAALLAARANKLKGSKVAELDKEAEERRKKTLLAMKQSEEESGRVGTMLKKGNEQQPAETPNLGNKETTPPVEDGKKTNNLRGKGANISSLEDDGPFKRKAKGEEVIDEKPKVNKLVKEEKKESPKPEKKNVVGAKIAPLGENESKMPLRRKKKTDDEEPEGLDFSSVKSDTPKEQKKVDEVKEEPAPSPEPKKKLSKDGGAKIVAQFDEQETAPRRRRKEKISEEEEADPFKGLEKSKKVEEQEKKEAEEKAKKEEQEKKEAEEKERKVQEEEEKKKKLSDLSGAKKIASLAPVEDAGPIRRRKAKAVDDEPEPDFLKTATKDEPKKEEEKPLTAAEERAKALKERREALAAKKAGISAKPAATETSDKPLSETEQKAKTLKERREALAAKKANAAPQPTADATESPAAERARSLKERRDKLAERKSALSKPTTEATTSDKPKVDIASSLVTEDKPLSLKERRALLAEKKRQMGK